MYLFVLILILILILLYTFLRLKSCPIERFSEVTEMGYDDHQDQIINDGYPATYAEYDPKVSGRHLQFFSHAPRMRPLYPEITWRPFVTDKYNQPAFHEYFYRNGYMYPLY
jgi:hypothetical protein